VCVVAASKAPIGGYGVEVEHLLPLFGGNVGKESSLIKREKIG
jgi:hypothetical protein